MALAKKCDRCGKLYEHYSGFNACIMTHVDIRGHVDSMTTKNDLCPDCMEAFTDFMKSPQNSTEDIKEETNEKAN